MAVSITSHIVNLVVGKTPLQCVLIEICEFNNHFRLFLLSVIQTRECIDVCEHSYYVHPGN